jgi:hypothetical protein
VLYALGANSSIQVRARLVCIVYAGDGRPLAPQPIYLADPPQPTASNRLEPTTNNPQPKVFDLGASGREPARKAAEVADFVDAACRAAQGGQPVFRLGGDKRGTAVKYIAPIRELDGNAWVDRCTDAWMDGWKEG